MDAIKFLMEYNRMHQIYYTDCENCPRHKEGCSLLATSKPYLEKLVADVEKWSKEHPEKTRMTDFLEKYPCAETHLNGIPKVCCAALGYREYCGKTFDNFDNGNNQDCDKCWNEVVEDDK